MSEVEIFLAELYESESTRTDRQRIRFVFDTIYHWLADGKANLCDDALRTVDVTRLRPDALLAFLTITNSTKSELSSRTDYLSRARQQVKTTHGNQKASKLFDGLREPMEPWAKKAMQSVLGI